MGSGGITLLRGLGLPMAVGFGNSAAMHYEVRLVYPLLPVLWGPNPIAFPSNLTLVFDTAGASLGHITSPVTPSETVIANEPSDSGDHVIAAQSLNGVCYSFYSLESYYENMADQAKGMLRNLQAAPPCNFPVFLPTARK